MLHYILLHICFYYRAQSTIQLKNKTGFIQRPTTLPTDVTLKLSDGSINVHKMMLAMVSPVFEKMFYGGFKEGRLDEVSLPKDNYKIINLLLNAIFEESCKMESLDDIFPLMEVAERYQVNKVPLQRMCSEAIVSQLSLSTYLTILPKYANLMSEDSLRKAAGKIMLYTKNACITDFDKAKRIPEEVLLFMLKRKDIPCNELELFRYLVKWHKYQNTYLGNSLQLTAPLFRCIRYSLIFPHLLLTEVANCELVDKQLITEALNQIFTSCDPLEKCNDIGYDDDCKQTIDSRKPCHGLENMKWFVETRGVSIDLLERSVNVKIVKAESKDIQLSLVKMELKKSGIYSFCTHSNGHARIILSISILDQSGKVLTTTDLAYMTLITLHVHGNDIFIKVIDKQCKKVKMNFYSSGSSPFAVRINANCNTSDTSVNYSFKISPV